MVFALVNLRARRGLAEESPADSTKVAARRTGMRGETFAYWYLRRRGYVIVSRNFTVPGVKGEIDLAGYDGKVLAFIEVKTRAVGAEGNAQEDAAGKMAKILPEDAINAAKRHSLVRMAKQFMAEWRIAGADCRFDVLAIESQPGKTPVVRLHKDCFGISGRV
jgi:putative endonuclease